MQPTLLPVDADEYSVTRLLEAYLLWLFGYIMFNNTHGNSVDRILLPYAREIADGDENVPPYSWGANYHCDRIYLQPLTVDSATAA